MNKCTRIAQVSWSWSGLILMHIMGCVIWKALPCKSRLLMMTHQKTWLLWMTWHNSSRQAWVGGTLMGGIRTPAARSVWRSECSCRQRGCTRGTEPTPADPVYEPLLRNQTDGEPEPRVYSAAWSNSPSRLHLWRSEEHRRRFIKHINDWHFKFKPKTYLNESWDTEIFWLKRGYNCLF